MIEKRTLLDRVQTVYPELKLTALSLNEQGQYNRILITREAGGELLIFRFPRYPASLEMLRQETAVLLALQGRLPLPIPDPHYYDLEAPVGKAFAGYRLLPGLAFNRQEFGLIQDRAVLGRVAQQLAGFLRVLHEVPLSALPAALPVADRREEWVAIYERVKTLLFPYMRTRARAAVASHFTSYLDHLRHAAWQPVLRHGDFGLGNILFDPQSHDVTGVIDFAFAGPGDAITDLAAIGAAFGEEMLQQVLAHYPADGPALQRLRFYQGTFALQEALFGLENGDQVAFKAGMAAYV